MPVHYEVTGGVARITLDDAETRNALSQPMRRGIVEAVSRFNRDDTATLALLSGAGKGFCSGAAYSADVPQLQPVQPSAWDVRNRIRSLSLVFLDVWRSPKPVVAKVHGYCFAAGIQLAAACDVVIADEACRFGWPKLPLGGGFISPMVAWTIGPKRAKEMSFVAGSEMSGREAESCRLVNLAVPTDELDDVTERFITTAIRMPAHLLRAKKAQLNAEMERLGYPEATLAGAEWDTLAHEDPTIHEAYAAVRSQGFKAAIAHFNAPRVADGDG